VCACVFVSMYRQCLDACVCVCVCVCTDIDSVRLRCVCDLSATCDATHLPSRRTYRCFVEYSGFDSPVVEDAVTGNCLREEKHAHNILLLLYVHKDTNTNSGRSVSVDSAHNSAFHR